jgi:hypothetical protein
MSNPNTLKRIMIIAFILIGIVIFSSCADVSHVHQCLPVTEHTYGFWGGAWHGTIAPLSFIGELFSDDISIYAVNNNGRWYDFGYVIGLVGAIKLFAVGFQILISTLGALFK